MVLEKHGFWKRLGVKYRDEGGSATIEFVIMFPLFLLLLSLIVDTALIFHGQARALRIVQDANRSYSVGRFTETLEAETYIETSLSGLSNGAEATSVYASGSITSVVTIPVRDLAMIGMISALTNFSISVQAEHLVEF